MSRPPGCKLEAARLRYNRTVLAWLRNKWQRDLVTLRTRRERERRKRKILCPRCGYDVKELLDLPCPECGLFIDPAWRNGWVGAGSSNRDMLASVGILSSGSLAVYIALIVIGIAIMAPVTTWRPDLCRNPMPAAFLCLAFLFNAALAAHGWRNRRRFLHGPSRPTVVYVAVCLALVSLTFGLWSLLAVRTSIASGG
jgi:hypothetical protein